MGLPIFSDNLRSSASWTLALERERQAWRETETGSVIRERQVREALKRSGYQIDEGRIREAAGLTSSWAGDPEAEMSAERLLETHRVLAGTSPPEDLLRKTEPLPINSMHDPTPAILLPRMLDNAFDWFTTPGFNELHPVEQAAVVYLRLLDLHPFPTHTETTALIAAGFYTERKNLPPLIVFADETTLARHENALEAAFRMLTQPLVEFFAEMLTRTMRLGCGNEK